MRLSKSPASAAVSERGPHDVGKSICLLMITASGDPTFYAEIACSLSQNLQCVGTRHYARRFVVVMLTRQELRNNREMS